MHDATRDLEGGDRDRPIGVFDSGVGGLAVLREVRRLLPNEELLYVADSEFAPYGDRPAAWIEARSIALVEFMVGLGAKAIVIACNTATGVSATTLRERFTLPIVAMEPAVKLAAASTKSGVIGVLATTRTLASPNYQRLRERFAVSVDVLSQACPGLANRVEAGELTGPETRALIASYVLPLVAKGIDTLVLGCTHYSFLTGEIQAIAGPDVTLIDPAAAVARQVQRRLADAGLLRSSPRSAADRFVTSGDPERVGLVIGKLWHAPSQTDAMPSLSFPRLGEDDDERTSRAP